MSSPALNLQLDVFSINPRLFMDGWIHFSICSQFWRCCGCAISWWCALTINSPSVTCNSLSGPVSGPGYHHLSIANKRPVVLWRTREVELIMLRRNIKLYQRTLKLYWT